MFPRHYHILCSRSRVEETLWASSMNTQIDDFNPSLDKKCCNFLITCETSRLWSSPGGSLRRGRDNTRDGFYLFVYVFFFYVDDEHCEMSCDKKRKKASEHEN